MEDKNKKWLTENEEETLPESERSQEDVDKTPDKSCSDKSCNDGSCKSCKGGSRKNW